MCYFTTPKNFFCKCFAAAGNFFRASLPKESRRRSHTREMHAERYRGAEVRECVMLMSVNAFFDRATDSLPNFGAHAVHR